MEENQRTTPQKKHKFPYRPTAKCLPWFRGIYYFALAAYRLIYGLRVIGRENIPEGAAVICPRHCTAIDPPMVYFAMGWKHYARVIAKQELLEIPVLGRILYNIGVFGVRRGENDISPIKNGLRCLNEGTKLIIFPEGTRVHEGEHVEAQTGAIMFALKTGAPLLPVYLTRAKKFHRMTIVFGEPYHPQIAGKRATPEENRKLADELLEKIYALESKVQ